MKKSQHIRRTNGYRPLARGTSRIDGGGLGVGSIEPAAERVDREAMTAAELVLGQAATPPQAEEALPVHGVSGSSGHRVPSGGGSMVQSSRLVTPV
jgi:hypothetical protein